MGTRFDVDVIFIHFFSQVIADKCRNIWSRIDGIVLIIQVEPLLVGLPNAYIYI